MTFILCKRWMQWVCSHSSVLCQFCIAWFSEWDSLKPVEMESELMSAHTHTHTHINPSCPFTHPLSSSYCEVMCVCSCFDTSMGILNAPHLKTPVAFWRTKHQRNLHKLSAGHYITIQKCSALKRSSLSATYIAYPQILWILIYISPNGIS